MANLIPPQAKRGIKIEYWTRVASVWLLLFGFAALSMAALNVPVYVLIQNQLVVTGERFADASSQSTSLEEAEAAIKEANDVAVLLATAQETQPLMPYVTKLEALVGEGITIESLTIDRVDGALESMRVTGVATDRQSLVSFSERIEAQVEFVSADIPLSNLAKDRDIPFMLTVEIDTTVDL